MHRRFFRSGGLRAFGAGVAGSGLRQSGAKFLFSVDGPEVRAIEIAALLSVVPLKRDSKSFLRSPHR